MSEPVLKLALPSYTIYSISLPLPSLTFYGPPPELRAVLRYTYFWLNLILWEFGSELHVEKIKHS